MCVDILILRSVGSDVVWLQKYLNKVAGCYNTTPELFADGVFDRQTADDVRILQRTFGIKDSGVVTSATWNILSEVCNAILAGE